MLSAILASRQVPGAVPPLPPKPPRSRRRALLFLELASCHRARGDDPRLVAALVRAAWRQHEQADAARQAAPATTA